MKDTPGFSFFFSSSHFRKYADVRREKAARGGIGTAASKWTAASGIWSDSGVPVRQRYLSAVAGAEGRAPAVLGWVARKEQQLCIWRLLGPTRGAVPGAKAVLVL